MNNKTKVLNYLEAGHTLTAYDGFIKFNIVSVRDYISMLRAEGYKILDEWRYSNDFSKRFKEYFLVNDAMTLTSNGK